MFIVGLKLERHITDLSMTKFSIDNVIKLKKVAIPLGTKQKI